MQDQDIRYTYVETKHFHDTNYLGNVDRGEGIRSLSKSLNVHDDVEDIRAIQLEFQEMSMISQRLISLAMYQLRSDQWTDSIFTKVIASFPGRVVYTSRAIKPIAKFISTPVQIPNIHDWTYERELLDNSW